MVEGPAVSARDEMLGHIRAALAPEAPAPEVPRAYRCAGELADAGAAALVERFCERVADYRATVTRADGEEELLAAIAVTCAERGSERIAAAPEATWRPAGLEVVIDRPEDDPRGLDSVDAALTGCAAAVAETGTIALDGGPISGRRALTLIPDHHVCVVRAQQVVASVPDAIGVLGPAARDGRPITLVSGPSATSDIELERVEGVHGPRLLDVIVVG
jgi:L-lactate dehydrogenase complex protein LldG